MTVTTTDTELDATHPMMPWSTVRTARRELEAFAAAAAYESQLFTRWLVDEAMAGRKLNDESQAMTLAMLARGGVRSVYTDHGAEHREKELAAAGADGFLTIDQWRARFTDGYSVQRYSLAKLGADIEMISLMRWAFAHEARMAKCRDYATDVRQAATAAQIQRMHACARGEVLSLDFYAMNGALGALTEVKADAAARRAANDARCA
jgi:hypothetical protein